MDLRRLRYLVCVGEERSFTRAARKLNLSQPTLSQQIRDLEAELGVTLFVRTAHKVEITEVGALAIDHAMRVLASVQVLNDAILEYKGLRHARLRIGVTQTFNALYFPSIVAAFSKDHPSIELEILELANDAIHEEVEAGSLHLGVGLPPGMTRGVVEPLYADTLMFVCAARHRLAGASPIAITQLADESVAMLTHGFRTRRLVEGFLAVNGVTPLGIIEFNTFSAILNVVESSRHVSIVPAAVRQGRGTGALHFAPLVPEPPSRMVCLLRAQPGRETPAAARFADYIKAECSTISA